MGEFDQDFKEHNLKELPDPDSECGRNHGCQWTFTLQGKTPSPKENRLCLKLKEYGSNTAENKWKEVLYNALYGRREYKPRKKLRRRRLIEYLADEIAALPES